MGRKSLRVVIFMICLGLVMTGCAKKTVMKEQPSAQKIAELATEKELAAKIEAERREQEAREAARIKEEEAKRREESQKEFGKSLVAKKTPGIEGTVFESGLLKDIHFDFDRYDIRLEDAEILKENAARLANYPHMKIQIEGHCDERGTGEYNLALGERRASSVKNYLISLGISGNLVSTISYGEEKPLDPGHSEDAWSKNRRAHFVVLSK